MKKRVAAMLLALLMTVTMIDVARPTSVQAEDLYTAKSGVTITSKGDTVRGKVPAGEKTFVINISTKANASVNFKPYISYNKSDDANYNSKIADLETKVSFYKKDGTKEMGYYWNSQNGSFVEKATKTNEFTIQNHISSSQSYGVWEKYLKKGNYQMVYTLPEEVKEGARIYLSYEISEGDEDDVDVSVNTKQTAKVVRAGSGESDFNSYYYTLTPDGKEEYWFKVVSAGKRTLTCDFYGSNYIQNKIAKFQLYDKNGKLVKEKVVKGELDTEDDLEIPVYDYMDDVNFSVSKGTYYLKMSAPNATADSYVTMDVYLERAAQPKVTYWALGKGVVKGTAEAGSRAYAIINGKTYKAAKKTSAKGKFSIQIPKSVKAGTTISVYIVDGDGKMGDDVTTVTMQSAAKAPTVSCKKGTKVVSGKTYPKAKVSVWYQGKKYTTTANSSGKFTVKTTKTLQAGKQVTVQVRRSSGNLSAKKAYIIK